MLETLSGLSNLCREGEVLRWKIEDTKKALRPFVSDDLVMRNYIQFTFARTSTWTKPWQLQSVKGRQKMPWWKQMNAT
jgi:hypothetical protein